jgi:hypothetical protein
MSNDANGFVTKVGVSGTGSCTCGWVSAHYAHGDDLEQALNLHDAGHVFTGPDPYNEALEALTRTDQKQYRKAARAFIVATAISAKDNEEVEDVVTDLLGLIEKRTEN